MTPPSLTDSEEGKMRLFDANLQIATLFVFTLFLFFIQSYLSQIRSIILEQSALIGGGLLSGSLHALTGPDHLAALLPSIVGRRWYISYGLGAVWGLGHGLSACLMGLFGYFIKGSPVFSMIMPQLIGLADYAVGITLVVIGMMGIHESRAEKSDEVGGEVQVQDCETDGDLFLGVALKLPANAGEDDCCNPGDNCNQEPVLEKQADPTVLIATIFLNGCLLGLSWDGLPSLSPALALDSLALATLFFLSYLIGTVLTMAVTTAIIGESTVWLGSISSINLPKRLAFASSLCAITIGACWIVYALIKFIEVTEDERYEGKFSLTWIGCCVMAVGSPLAVVGVIAMTVLRELGIDVKLPCPCGEAFGGVYNYAMLSPQADSISSRRHAKGGVHVV